MTLELLFIARRNDQIGDLRRKKATQPAHAFYFADLIGNAPFELLIEFRNLLGSLAQFLQQTSALNGNHGLGGKVLQELDVLVGKRPHFLAIDGDRSDERVVLEHRNGKQASRTGAFDDIDAKRIARRVSRLSGHVCNSDRLAGSRDTGQRGLRTRPNNGVALPPLREVCRAMQGCNAEQLTITQEKGAQVRLTEFALRWPIWRQKPASSHQASLR